MTQKRRNEPLLEFGDGLGSCQRVRPKTHLTVQTIDEQDARSRKLRHEQPSLATDACEQFFAIVALAQPGHRCFFGGLRRAHGAALCQRKKASTARAGHTVSQSGLDQPFAKMRSNCARNSLGSAKPASASMGTSASSRSLSTP